LRRPHHPPTAPCPTRDLACIGIGSETSGGVRNVRIEHCKLHRRPLARPSTSRSRVGRGAFVEDISVTDADVSGMKQGFLQITNISSGKSDGAIP